MVFLWLLGGLVLLYFWLLGHWFARVTAFLLFAGLLGLMGSLDDLSKIARRSRQA